MNTVKKIFGVVIVNVIIFVEFGHNEVRPIVKTDAATRPARL